MLRSKTPAGGKNILAVAQGLAVWRKALARHGDCPLASHGTWTGLTVSGQGCLTGAGAVVTPEGGGNPPDSFPHPAPVPLSVNTFSEPVRRNLNRTENQQRLCVRSVQGVGVCRAVFRAGCGDFGWPLEASLGKRAPFRTRRAQSSLIMCSFRPFTLLICCKSA